VTKVILSKALVIKLALKQVQMYLLLKGKDLTWAVKPSNLPKVKQLKEKQPKVNKEVSKEKEALLAVLEKVKVKVLR